MLLSVYSRTWKENILLTLICRKPWTEWIVWAWPGGGGTVDQSLQMEMYSCATKSELFAQATSQQERRPPIKYRNRRMCPHTLLHIISVWPVIFIIQVRSFREHYFYLNILLHFAPFPEELEKPLEYLHGPAASSWVLQYIMSVMWRRWDDHIQEKGVVPLTVLCSCWLVSIPLPRWGTPVKLAPLRRNTFET